ncbi:MAG: hypothetical protein HY262_09550 [Chloroflexi bacterium]|nr:hypothetical protein [Chloroflexota bacterium]
MSNGESVGDLDGTTTVVPFPDDTSRLVWVIDESGTQLSNKVAIDEPARLRAILEERGEDGARPAGIEAADLETPVGQMLARLHAACIFDFDETPTARRIAHAADSESEDPDFWDRLAREDLRQDPRVARYLQLGGDTPLLDGIFLDIARMLEMVPGLLSLHPVEVASSPGTEHGTGTAWTPDRKLQVRLFNLLERWCAALSDPRLQWISPLTPVANFAALVGALRECWSQGYLPEHRVVALVGVLMSAFVRGERRPGFLTQLADEDRSSALATLATSAAPSVAAALVFVAVRTSQKDLLTYLFAWQPALADGLASGVLRADEYSSALVHGLSGLTMSPAAIMERIRWASTYLDDARWSETISREMGLPIALTTRHFAAKFGATVSVGSGVDLLGDARVVEVVRRAIAYRKTDGCIVESDGNRLSIQLLDTFVARVDAVTVESDGIITIERLEAMVASGAPFSELAWTDENVAS